MSPIFWIAAGGALGSVLRYGVGRASVSVLGAFSFPFGTLIVNVVGSLVMGLLIGMFAHKGEDFSENIKAFLIVGVLGGFTTFSTFSLDAITLYQRGDMLQMALYIMASLVMALGALVLGLYTIRGWIA